MHKFWSDEFDMDLLKLFPDLPKEIGETAEVKLWTVGGESFGRLNHPSVWNSHGAFIWTGKPQLDRDKHGWFTVEGGCTADSALIECTWLEVLRDQWAHHYGFILLPVAVYFKPIRWLIYERIMYHRRDWKRYDGHGFDLTEAKIWALTASRRLEHWTPRLQEIQQARLKRQAVAR